MILINCRDIHDKLYQYALNNRDFGAKLLMIYNYPTIKNVCDSEETSLYKHLVRRFQIDYESNYIFYLYIDIFYLIQKLKKLKLIYLLMNFLFFSKYRKERSKARKYSTIS